MERPDNVVDITNYSNHSASTVFNFPHKLNSSSFAGFNSLNNSSVKSTCTDYLDDKPRSLPFRFKYKDLDALYYSRKGANSYPEAVVKGFFKAMQMISAAKCERDLYSFRSLKFHHLNGNRQGEYALWLTGNWRLITKFEEEGAIRYLLILNIEDYH